MRRLAAALYVLMAAAALLGADQEPAQYRRPDAGERATVGGPMSPDGAAEIVVSLPGAQHQKNKGGSDGAGLCVFTSVSMCADWQNVDLLKAFRDWMTHHPGGGYPEKVDEMIKAIAAEKGLPVPEYAQYEGNEADVLDLAIKTGRMVGVTYGYGERYGQSIDHMVCLVHLDQRWACILDNNFPGEDKYEWMSREEFLRRWKMGGGGGWAFVLLAPPPVPVPRN